MSAGDAQQLVRKCLVCFMSAEATQRMRTQSILGLWGRLVMKSNTEGGLGLYCWMLLTLIHFTEAMQSFLDVSSWQVLTYLSVVIKRFLTMKNAVLRITLALTCNMCVHSFSTYFLVQVTSKRCSNIAELRTQERKSLLWLVLCNYLWKVFPVNRSYEQLFVIVCCFCSSLSHCSVL